jgi:hypothetical protein
LPISCRCLAKAWSGCLSPGKMHLDSGNAAFCSEAVHSWPFYAPFHVHSVPVMVNALARARHPSRLPPPPFLPSAPASKSRGKLPLMLGASEQPVTSSYYSVSFRQADPNGADHRARGQADSESAPLNASYGLYRDRNGQGVLDRVGQASPADSMITGPPGPARVSRRLPRLGCASRIPP